jgi:hypothetical protein
MSEALQVSQPTTALQQIDLGSEYLYDIDKFHNAWEMADCLSRCELLPDTFRGKPHNVMIAIEIAKRIRASVFAVTQNLYIVHGNPAWSSQFLIASINACGKFTPLRYKAVGNDNDDTHGVIAWAKDMTGEVLESTPVTMAMAKAEGWYGKNGSKWKTMPEQMLRYRAATFFARAYCPEITLGMRTQEEIIDITPAEEKKKIGLFKTAEKPSETTAETAETKTENAEQNAEVKTDEKIADALSAIDTELQNKGITDVTAANIQATCEKTNNKFNPNLVLKQIDGYAKWVRQIREKEEAEKSEAK